MYILASRKKVRLNVALTKNAARVLRVMKRCPLQGAKSEMYIFIQLFDKDRLSTRSTCETNVTFVETAQ